MVHSDGRATRDSEALRYSELHEIGFLCANITSLGEARLAAVSRAVTKYWNRSRARDDAKNEVPAAQRSSAEPRAAFRTRLRDATRRAFRAAEAAGQTTAARRLLRRVSRRSLLRRFSALDDT